MRLWLAKFVRSEVTTRRAATGLEAEYTLCDDTSVCAHRAAELRQRSELLGAFRALRLAQRVQDLLTTLWEKQRSKLIKADVIHRRYNFQSERRVKNVVLLLFTL